MEEEKMKIWKPVVSALMLGGGLCMNAFGVAIFQNDIVVLLWYLMAYLPVGWDVLREAWKYAMHGDWFSEFMLMSVATIGAFCIGEYPEGVAVMLLYCIGEIFQDMAVDHARDNIKSLMEFRPDKANVVDNGTVVTRAPEEVSVGDVVEVLPGERVPLDGILLSEGSAFNTAALTGESVPRMIDNGGEVLAGMISFDAVIRLRVSRPSSDSAVSRVLRLVEEAADRKAPTELFIHKFAHVYTPVVIGLAVLTIVLPWLFSVIVGAAGAGTFTYHFAEWFRRSLIFLVISCPCALVISIPLGYFGGIGAASRRGILFKGSNYLDAVTRLGTVVFDKTGTLTMGEFSVREVCSLSDADLLAIARIEQASSHPIARAVCGYVEQHVKEYADGMENTERDNVKNIAGYGLSAGEWLVGTLRLLRKEGIDYPEELDSVPETIVACARDGRFVGYLLLADTLKDDAITAIQRLHRCGIKNTEILSGDKQALVDKVARTLGVNRGYGDLLPQDKVAHIETLKGDGTKVAFVGDGINDAPVLALSDVGIAMGAMGADMAIETADIVIRTDQPSKVAEAISIGRRTHRIVYENITFALGVKVVVMVLGVLGVANLWEAVFADSGVALLAVLNSTRVFLKK